MAFSLISILKARSCLYRKFLIIKFTSQIYSTLFEEIFTRGCQIGMQGLQLCTKPRHFCKLDLATSRIAFLDLNLHVLQVQIQRIEDAL